MRRANAVESLQERWQRFRDAVPKPAQCRACRGLRLWWNGTRTRSASVRGDQGRSVHIPEIVCPRVKCADCKQSWTLRPEGLVPQRHYQLCVVADATARYFFEPDPSLVAVAQTVDCDRRTVGRWVDWLSKLAQPADLLRHVLTATGAPLLLRIPPLARAAGHAASAVRQGVRQRAAQVLCLLESLGSALGCEPPGLRSVVGSVWAGRYRATTYARPALPEFAHRRLWGLAPLCPHGP